MNSLIARKQITPATSLRRERNLDRKPGGGAGKEEEKERKAFAERKFARFAISDAAARPLLSLSRPLCFWSPEDNEHNYGGVFVLEITQ